MCSSSQIISIFLFVVFLVSTCSASCNETESSLSHCEADSRQKRFLSFPVNGGLLKVIFGMALPVAFNHKTKRSLNAAMNLQGNYRILQNIIWPVPEDIFTNRLNSDFKDSSRLQLYRVLEHILDTQGKNGRNCIMRTICDLADTPLTHNGMVGELIDLIFTPSETDDVEEEYRTARKYGMNGVNCSAVYKECPYGHGLLDAFSTIVSPLSNIVFK
ncbi:uncharacterized protein LOC134224458 [Armigeres subalbatus]|uniref:uncharacterized protein LOC134224458 n=1 Tax=Armigeres subalbatus TaxID=124917 RepID=UPI002ED2A158